ncbi:sigma-70 family RNA polymerase sigma factor [Catenuloplanes atrovinosus]|uniref:RNA polymerase sigma factor n=1 Tax=Catenuloplanes atrovinosus TaxID=137266 RepID=A0AAE4CCW3_9ACTN|nr:sigma-70 family RNA polymerase sigma factor [Catenuloplanes atrovinosus]MDR7276930.1 RNA polymerase sigma-70 factor (ECF subfamily) [Catenuloplanes atrovinosus]
MVWIDGEETDVDPLRHFQEVHRPALLAFATRLAHGDVHRAEDVVQETLLRAWRHPEARDTDGHWSRPWLLTVARRIVIDQARAARARPVEYLDDPALAHRHADPVDEIDRLLDRREVLAALSTLSARQRTILVELHLRGRTAVEVAAALGVPAGTVRSRGFYALRALRDALVRRGFHTDPVARTTRR